MLRVLTAVAFLYLHTQSTMQVRAFTHSEERIRGISHNLGEENPRILLLILELELDYVQSKEEKLTRSAYTLGYVDGFKPLRWIFC